MSKINRECEYCTETGVCEVTGMKCQETDLWDCPNAIDCYDPYYAGDCEDF